MSAQSVEIFMFVLKDKCVLQSRDIGSVLVILGNMAPAEFYYGPPWILGPRGRQVSVQRYFCFLMKLP